jgi:hypothetical protein
MIDSSEIKNPFPGFYIKLLPAEGYYSEKEQLQFLWPFRDWNISVESGLLEVGSAGVDGIKWVLRANETGVYAYYPVEQETIWKAEDGWKLISGWLVNTITV